MNQRFWALRGRETRCGKSNLVTIFVCNGVRISRKNLEVPTPVGKDSPIQFTICFASPEIGQQSERRVSLQIKLANPRLPRIKQSSVDNIHMPASGDDYRRRPPSRTVLLVRWPEGRAAPRSQRSRSQITLSSATFKCSGSLVGKACAERHGQPYVEDGIYAMPPKDIHRRDCL